MLIPDEQKDLFSSDFLSLLVLFYLFNPDQEQKTSFYMLCKFDIKDKRGAGALNGKFIGAEAQRFHLTTLLLQFSTTGKNLHVAQIKRSQAELRDIYLLSDNF